MMQFTLARLLLAITLICVALSLWGVNTNLSGMALFALAAWGAALLAIRAAWRNTAYALTALAAGVLWPLAVALPLSAVNHFFRVPFPSFALTVCAALVTVAAALAVRGIRKLTKFLDNRIFGSLFMGYFVAYGVLVMSQMTQAAGWLSAPPWEFSLDGFWFVFLVVTLSFYLFFPISYLILTMAQDAEAAAQRNTDRLFSVYWAVKELRRRGHNAIFTEDVAEEALLDPIEVEHCLQQLYRERRLDWSRENGYRLPALRPDG